MKTWPVLLILLCAPGLWAQAPVPDCAVLDLEGMGVDSVTSRTLSEKLRAEVFLTGAVRLVERNRMTEILAEQGFQQTGCTSSECRVETGRLLGVSQLVTGSVALLASSNTWSLSLSLIDVESGAVLQMRQWSGGAGVEDVLHTGIPAVVRNMFAPPVLPVSSPAAAPDTMAFTPLGFAFLYPLQVPFFHTAVYGLAINALYGKYPRIYGLSAGLASHVAERLYGAQIGFYNSSGMRLWGLQAGVINQAQEVRGAQIGLVNDCVSLQGVQIGLINRVRGRASMNGWVPIVNIGF